jgi:predicted dehydrogenase
MKKPLRGAIVGYGFIMEKGHVAAYGERAERMRAEGRTPDVEIVAVADVCRERREAAAKRFPGVRTYSDFLELVDAEAGNLDFVDIATPPAKHAAVARAALGRGLHVLCEKPLATTIADARDMLDSALAAKRVLFPCHNYKHAPVIRSVRRILESGAIGRVHLVTPAASANGARIGAASVVIRVAASPWITAATRSTWRSNGCVRTRPRFPAVCRT